MARASSARRRADPWLISDYWSVGYVVIAVFVCVLVWLWASWDRSRDSRVFLVGVTVVAVVGLSFGVNLASGAAVVADREQQWLDGFTGAHRQAWRDDCTEIMTEKDANGVLYARDSSMEYSIEWCFAQWRPPEQPGSYSAAELDQPDYVPPLVSNVLFPATTVDEMFRCVDAARQQCYTWDDYVTPPR